MHPTPDPSLLGSCGSTPHPSAVQPASIFSSSTPEGSPSPTKMPALDIAEAANPSTDAGKVLSVPSVLPSHALSLDLTPVTEAILISDDSNKILTLDSI